MFEPSSSDTDYTYGNRLGAHFGLDTLQTRSRRLRANPETRDAYISLWDTAYDLPGEHSHPCLVTLFFRRSQGALTLTATYRAHNLLTAWLLNVYGLMAIQRHVAEAVGTAGRADHGDQPLARRRSELATASRRGRARPGPRARSAGWTRIRWATSWSASTATRSSPSTASRAR